MQKQIVRACALLTDVQHTLVTEPVTRITAQHTLAIALVPINANVRFAFANAKTKTATIV